MNKKEEYGIITEQGDLGLGFEPISEETKEKIDENLKKEEKKTN